MRTILLAAVLAALSTAAAAQTAPPPEEIPGASAGDHPHGAHGQHGARGDRPNGPRLFISPSGEPFRGGDGLAVWFAGADLDHDGAITIEEFRADALRAFKAFDTNGDGVIDGFEIQAYEQQRAPEITQLTIEEPRRGGGRATPASSGAEPAAGRDGAARFSLLNEPEPILAADEDVDGRVTLREWQDATARRFALLDRDKTGRLTLDELRKAPKR